MPAAKRTPKKAAQRRIRHPQITPEMAREQIGRLTGSDPGPVRLEQLSPKDVGEMGQALAHSDQFAEQHYKYLFEQAASTDERSRILREFQEKHYDVASESRWFRKQCEELGRLPAVSESQSAPRAAQRPPSGLKKMVGRVMEDNPEFSQRQVCGKVDDFYHSANKPVPLPQSWRRLGVSSMVDAYDHPKLRASVATYLSKIKRLH